jgi:HPr kinase/phosphorylase
MKTRKEAQLPAKARRKKKRSALHLQVQAAPTSMPIKDLLSEKWRALGLRLIAGRKGLQRTITMSRVQRPGLALTGYADYIRYGRVQIIGGSEIDYLQQLTARKRAQAIAKLAHCPVSCFIVTKGRLVPKEFVRACNARAVALLITELDSTPFIKALTTLLDERLAPRIDVHGVLLDVFGLGVLVMGESGIGKSESALDLIDRGHRLVADDVTTLKRMGDTLVGTSPELTRYHMELRGLGVINIKDLYGVSAIRTTKRVELVVSLERWESGKEYDRLGLRDERHHMLGIDLPLLRMPVAPGRNIALLIEVAARNQLLKERGYNAAARFTTRVNRLISAGKTTAGQ